MANKEQRRAARVDPSGRAYAGSQRQVQIFVNERAQYLSDSVTDALMPYVRLAAVEWRAPLAKHGFSEPLDRGFLESCGLEKYCPKLEEFWPKSGPRWDAIAIARTVEGAPTVLLVEGKSYPAEVIGNGCQATEPALGTITRSMLETKRWLGVELSADWLGRYYQYANRLAHVYFLREIVQVDAWLVNLCFLNDSTTKSTSMVQWLAELAGIRAALGFSGTRVPYAVDVFLESVPREYAWARVSAH